MEGLVTRIKMCPFVEGIKDCSKGAHYKNPRCRRDYEHCRAYKTEINSNKIGN